jgi:hypothetical protein
MHLLRYSRGIYGDDLLVGASWSLLWWFVAAGMAFIVVHAAYKAITGTTRRGRS